jgi:hypothetical protein
MRRGEVLLPGALQSRLGSAQAALPGYQVEGGVYSLLIAHQLSAVYSFHLLLFPLLGGGDRGPVLIEVDREDEVKEEKGDEERQEEGQEIEIATCRINGRIALRGDQGNADRCPVRQGEGDGQEGIEMDICRINGRTAVPADIKEKADRCLGLQVKETDKKEKKKK